MDLKQWEALTGMPSQRYWVDEPLFKKITQLLRHGNRCRVAMDAYGHSILGDVMQCILQKYTYLVQELSRGDVAGVPVCDLCPYALSCIRQRGARTKNRLYIVGNKKPDDGLFVRFEP